MDDVQHGLGGFAGTAQIPLSVSWFVGVAGNVAPILNGLKWRNKSDSLKNRYGAGSATAITDRQGMNELYS